MRKLNIIKLSPDAKLFRDKCNFSKTPCWLLILTWDNYYWMQIENRIKEDRKEIYLKKHFLLFLTKLSKPDGILVI